MERVHEADDGEYSMQRFLDVADKRGCGLAVANDGKYAFNLTEGRTQITVARSAIYAQGSSPDWENEIESYEYMDIGTQTYHLLLRPHGERLPASELYRIAEKANGSYEYLMDSAHMPLTRSGRNSVLSSFAATDRDNVAVQVVKKAEDDDGFIIRLLELQGEDTDYHLFLMGNVYSLKIGHYEIQTIKTDREGRNIKTVNLLEWEEERDQNGER